MSHVAKIQIEIKDLEALRAACTRMGFEFVEAQRTYRWYGTHMGDYPLPEGFTADDLGHCEHAIRVPDAGYEVGVCRRRDSRPGYTLLWDFWQGGYGLERQLGKNGQRLVQAYGVEAAKHAARRAGYSVTETTNQDGSVTLRVQTGA